MKKEDILLGPMLGGPETAVLIFPAAYSYGGFVQLKSVQANTVTQEDTIQPEGGVKTRVEPSVSRRS
ncbi:MAG: hypothetical protein IPL91_16210 [Hyphomicrobium sp.]|nr:hypothetical protein [Hyphomicrobium sp.]